MVENSELTKKLSPNLLTKRIDEVDLGRKAPQNIEMEKAILSAIMIDNEAFENITDILTDNSFYLPSHQMIFKSCKTITERNQPIDIGVLADQMSKDGVLESAGGPAYLIELSNIVGSSANVEFHARIVAQKYIQRELIKMGNQTIKNSYDNTKDVFETLDETETKIYELAENYNSQDPISTSSILGTTLNELNERMKKAKTEELQGVETGFKKLNDMTGGWQKGDLIIIAGRPGMGKTALTLTLARNASVMANKSVIFFSLEMPNDQLMNRLISSETEIELKKIRQGTISGAELNHISSKMDMLKNTKLFFDDTPGLSLLDFRKKVRKIKRDHGLGLIVIDYLQLMTTNLSEGNGKIVSNREQQIALISRTLKAIAKELEVPIIALAQLSRQAESRGKSSKPGKPMLSDLRESGSIEQDADMVIFIYRESQYVEGGRDEEGNDISELAKISVAKNRNGETEDFDARFIGKYTKYCEWEGNEFSDRKDFISQVKNKSSDDFNANQTITVKSKINNAKINHEEGFIGDDNTPPPFKGDDLSHDAPIPDDYTPDGDELNDL